MLLVITGTGLLKRKLSGVKSVVSKAGGATADLYVEQGYKVKVGNLYLEVRSKPGHTRGCVAYVTCEGSDQVYPRLALTGDALSTRGCGRTDFKGERRYFTIPCTHRYSLPSERLVYPDRDYKEQTVTTAGEVKRYNPRLSKDLATFKTNMSNLKLAFPAMIDKEVPANL